MFPLLTQGQVKPRAGHHKLAGQRCRWLNLAAIMARFLTASTQGDRYHENLTSKSGRQKLKISLIIRDEARGFAGLSGRVWVIEPDGRWRIVIFGPFSRRDRLDMIDVRPSTPTTHHAKSGTI